MYRDLLDKLKKWKDKTDRKPLLLQGVRQVGKTYLLQHFGKECFPFTHYLNFEEDPEIAQIFERNFDPSRIVSELSFYLNKDIRTDRDLLIFDEIQACPRALTSLKYFCEKMPALALCAAGSLLGIHLTSVSYPVGKVDMMHLYPMSFAGFLRAIGDNRSLEYLQLPTSDRGIPQIVHQHLWERFKWYLVVGGLPEVVSLFSVKQDNLFEAFQQVRSKQKELVAGYLADIAKHSGKENAMHIERVWQSVPSQLARDQDGSAHKFQFKGIVPGIDRYSRLAGAIDWLEAAGLVVKVKIAHSGLLPPSAYTTENVFKLFMFDVGILGAISRLAPKTLLDYDFGSYKGYFAENFVAQEFLCGGMDVLYSWQEGRSEVEFLIQENGGIIPVEVKSGVVTKAKSLWKFKEKYHPKSLIILSGKPPSHTHDAYYYPLYLAKSLALRSSGMVS